MPERTSFDSSAGIRQNRIQPTELSPLEGDYVFVLGSEVYAVVDVDSSDNVVLDFDWDFTASPLGFFGIFFRITKHADTPTGYWRLTVDVQGTVLWSIDIDYDFDQGWFPIRIPTGKATGVRTISFKLERI